MLYFWKTKEFLFVYKVKIQFRFFKDFLIQIFKLYRVKTNLNLIFSFIVNHYKSFNDNDKYIKKLYESSKFDYPDWISTKIPILIHYLNKYTFSKKLNLLEIGSFEGRSSIFFIEYFKTKLLVNDINLTCVDTWKGSYEQVHKKIDFNIVEENFDNNIKLYKDNINKYKSSSHDFFKLKNLKEYDFIFIDGSHEFDDVLADANSSFKLLKQGGFMLFDDFNWFHYKDLKMNPAYAINVFLKEKKRNFDIIFVDMMVLIKKK